MAIAFVSRSQGGSTASLSNVGTPAQAHTAGNLLVALFQWQNAGITFSSIANTAGDTWTQAGSQVDSGTNHSRIYYASNCIGHASDVTTVNFSGNAVYRTITVYEFSGVATAADPLDDADQATGSSTGPATPSLTVTASEDVIVAFMLCAADTVTAGSGYTLVNFSITGDATKYFADEYHIVTASEAATATCANGSWYIEAAAFKTASAVAGQPTMRRWGGVPYMGGQGIGQKGKGRAWGRSRVSGLFSATRRLRMITLTTPSQINTVLGGSTLVAYNKLVIGPFTMDGVTQIVNGTLRLTSTTVPTATPILGTLSVNIPGGNEFVLTVPQLDIVRRLVLTSPQATSIIGQIETAQAALENGLVTLAVVAGTRTSGV